MWDVCKLKEFLLACTTLNQHGIIRFSGNICHLLDLFVDNDANSMLGYIVHTSRLTMVALVRHSFLNCTCALMRHHMQLCSNVQINLGSFSIKISKYVVPCLNINNVTLLVNAHVCWQRDWACEYTKPINIQVCSLYKFQTLHNDKDKGMLIKVVSDSKVCTHHVCGMAC